MSRISRAIAEMTGRVDPQSTFGKIFASFWANDVTADFSRSDYLLFEAVYHASIMKDGKKTVGEDFILGAGFAKPIINATTAFTIGQGFNVTFDDAEKGTPIRAAQDDLTQWIKEHSTDFYNLLKYGLRGGDGFMVLHDDGGIEFLKPDTVTVVYDPTNGGVIGYDVEEVVDNGNNSKTTYKRIYRKSGYKVVKITDGGAEEVLIDRAFTTDGIVDVNLLSQDEENSDGLFESDDLIEVPLPVFHFANELEPKSIYGMSDLQNTLVYFKGYSKILQEATKSNIYNSTPIPIITGDNKGLLEADGSAKNISWGRNMVLYLKGEKANAKFMEVPQTMADTGKLLEYYFYLIVQASETPEFIFGAALSSSKASAQEQMPIMVKKALRKQAQLKQVLNDVVNAYVYMKYIQGDQNFFAVYSGQVDFTISFPPIVDEDKQLTLDTIKTLVDNGILSDATALKLANLDQISDIDDELARAREDADRREARMGVLPEPAVVADDELDTLDDDGNPIVPDES